MLKDVDNRMSTDYSRTEGFLITQNTFSKNSPDRQTKFRAKSGFNKTQKLEKNVQKKP